MRSAINSFIKTCDICQRVKGRFPRLGHLPVKKTEVNPWDEVQIDLVGPWTFQIPPKWSVSVLVLTSIDPFSGLCDACRLENKTSLHVANKYYSLWLTRYPRPLRCIHDNGTEFTAPPFQQLLQHMGIQNVTTTVKNPQENSVIERMHLTFGQLLRSILTQGKVSQNEQHSDLLHSYIDTALSSSLYAINSAINSTTKVSPGTFIFHRDMLLPIQYITNWELIRHRKQLRIHHNIFLENQHRRPFTYTPKMEVILHDPTGVKLSANSKGLYTISKVHSNGTVTMCLKPNVFQQVNIRRIKPYFR